jgi:hypothetical protein
MNPPNTEMLLLRKLKSNSTHLQLLIDECQTTDSRVRKIIKTGLLFVDREEKRIPTNIPIDPIHHSVHRHGEHHIILRTHIPKTEYIYIVGSTPSISIGITYPNLLTLVTSLNDEGKKRIGLEPNVVEDILIKHYFTEETK